MKKLITTSLVLLLAALTYIKAQAKKPPEEVWLEIKNATAFEEEFIRKDLAKKFKSIVKFKRDKHFGADKGISFDGGIRISFMDEASCAAFTRKVWTYNLDLEKIEIQSIKISRGCIDQYDETNRYYSFINIVTHEVACHAVTDGLDHTQWGLCRQFLSTDKVYWGKRHRKYVRKNLNLPGKTGQYLMI